MKTYSTIQQRRLALGLSQAQLARLAKVSLGAVRLAESGMSTLSLAYYQAIRTALQKAEKDALEKAAEIMRTRDER